MLIRPKKKRFAGLEITKTSLNISQIEGQEKGWYYLGSQTAVLPEDTLSFAYRSPNIQEPEAFREALIRSLQMITLSSNQIGLSLPNEIVKILIQHYKDLPPSQEEITKMVTYWAAKTVRLPPETLKISYQYITHSRSMGHRLLVAIAFKAVVEQYLEIIEDLNLISNSIGPSALNQFNFYCETIPPEGRVGFLGIFENYSTFMIFEDSDLVYYKGIKNGLANIHTFFAAFDRVLQHYLKNNPDHLVEQLFIASQVGLHQELTEVFSSLSDMDVEVMNEIHLIHSNTGLNEMDTRKELARFGAGIGAAQSLDRNWR